MAKRWWPAALLGLLAAACGSPSQTSPSIAPLSTPTASATLTAPSATPSPSFDVTPLIPDLTASGALNLLHENGSVVATFPPSMSLELFSPFGDGFLGARQVMGQPTALVSIQADGSLNTLAPIADPATFAGATGALDGHAWAWLAGPRYSGLCNSGLASGTLDVQGPGTAAHVAAQLPKGAPGSAWSLGGWVGDNLWLVQTTGCPSTGTSTTAGFVAHESGGPLTPVQGPLGPGCALAAIALDGSMLCTATPAEAANTTWRFVGGTGIVRNFSRASLGPLCAGHGAPLDFEGFALTLDAGYIAVDAGCVDGARFDQLFIIPTATGKARLVTSTTSLGADAWLPDGRLLCSDLSDPSQAQSYLVSVRGDVAPLAAGDAIWSNTDVIW